MSDQENKSELKEENITCVCPTVPLPDTGCQSDPVRQVGDYSKIIYYKEKKRKTPEKKIYSYSKRKTRK